MADPIEQKLLDLGKTPEEIVKSLRQKNMRGRRGRPQYCIIANLLARESGQECISFVYTYWVGDKYYSHTHAMAEVIRKFDQGQFPELEE